MASTDPAKAAIHKKAHAKYSWPGALFTLRFFFRARKIAWEALQDPSLIFLCFSAMVSFVVGIVFQRGMEWIEVLSLCSERLVHTTYFFLAANDLYVRIQGLAILSAVAVVVAVTAINDYQKEQQFRALNDVKEDSQVPQPMPAGFCVHACLFVLIMSCI
jgi:hypothetical protein